MLKELKGRNVTLLQQFAMFLDSIPVFTSERFAYLQYLDQERQKKTEQER